jgi:hypothetical protein
MPKQIIALHHLAVAVSVAAAFALSMPSAGQAAQQTDVTTPVKKHATKTHHAKRKDSPTPRGTYAAAPNTDASGRCAWPYQNQFPPCQSTWPAGDPNFHGSTHPGVTFDAPWDPRDAPWAPR